MMNALKRAVREYAGKNANGDGLAITKVPGLRMMCVSMPSGPLHSIYRPLVCLILQGSKRMAIGSKDSVFKSGESVIVTGDIPISGTVVAASPREPYLALAVELNAGLLRELAAEMHAPSVCEKLEVAPLFVQTTDGAALDCALRLMRLLDHPEAIPVLHLSILRELHYWLLAGEHGAMLRSLALPDSNSNRLAASIALLRTEFRSKVPVSRLADAAAMSLTNFHIRFKQLTLMTPIQFQKRLRLIEARRLLVHEGSSASQAAFDVGYESVSQFTREYSRMFGSPPKRYRLSATSQSEQGACALLAQRHRFEGYSTSSV
jgi:AraC-like DNA-binding protein